MGKSNIPKIDCLPSNLGKIHHQVWCTGRVKMTEVVLQKSVFIEF